MKTASIKGFYPSVIFFQPLYFNYGTSNIYIHNNIYQTLFMLTSNKFKCETRDINDIKKGANLIN